MLSQPLHLAVRPNLSPSSVGRIRPLTPDPKVTEKNKIENAKAIHEQDADHLQHLASLVAASGDSSDGDDQGFFNVGQLSAHMEAHWMAEQRASRAQLAYESLSRRKRRLAEVDVTVKKDRAAVAAAQSERAGAMAA